MSRAKRPPPARGKSKASNTPPRRGAARVPGPDPSARQVVELKHALKELQVVKAKLRRQSRELKRTYNQLELEKRRFETLFDSAPDAYVVTDIHGIIQEANQAAAALLAVGRRSLLNDALPLFAQLPQRRAFRSKLAAARSATTKEFWEFRLGTRGGWSFDAELMVAPVRDRRGETRALRWVIRDITARKQAEQQILELNAQLERRVQARTAELVESNAKIASILNSITDGYLSLDPQWRLTDANPNAEKKLLGIAKEHLLGKVFWEEYPDAVESEFYRQYHLAVAEQRPVHFEAKSTIADRWFETHAYPSKEELDIYFRDITERKQAEQVQSRLAAIVASSDDAIIGLTLDAIIESWGKGAQRLFGYSAEEAIGQPISIIYPPDRPNEFPGMAIKLRRGERIEHYETERVRKDGTPLAVSLSISPIRDATGKLIGAAKIARDVTAEKRAREAEHFLSEASEVLAGSLDYDTTVQTVARLALPFLAEYSVLELAEEDGTLRRAAIAATDPHKEELLGELMERYGPGPKEMGTRGVLETGQPLLISQIPLPDESASDPRTAEILNALSAGPFVVAPMRVRGRGLGTLWLGRSATAVPLDRHDLVVAEDLARRAAYALDNARLYQESQAGLIARDQFLSVASHEVRTPLTVIQGYTQLLRQQLDQVSEEPAAPVVYERAKLVRTLENIDYATSRLITLVADLLDVSRMRERGLNLEPQRVNLNRMLLKVIEDVRAQQQYRGHRRGVEFDVRLPQPEIWGEWDDNRLAQVLMNLVDNAVKYSPRSSVVHVGLALEQNGSGRGPESQAHVSVRDEGIGIPPEEVDKVFEPFTRASNAVKLHYPGLGLGLAVSKEIVAQHGGRIWAESAGLDRGCTFHIVLPVVK